MQEQKRKEMEEEQRKYENMRALEEELKVKKLEYLKKRE